MVVSSQDFVVVGKVQPYSEGIVCTVLVFAQIRLQRTEVYNVIVLDWDNGVGNLVAVHEGWRELSSSVLNAQFLRNVSYGARSALEMGRLHLHRLSSERGLRDHWRWSHFWTCSRYPHLQSWIRSSSLHGRPSSAPSGSHVPG